MFSSSRRPAQPPQIDLETMRATLTYMHDDAARTPGFGRLAAAFANALKEIDAAAGQGAAHSVDVVSTKFIRYRR